jgi:YVTN family beta-propeller protein
MRFASLLILAAVGFAPAQTLLVLNKEGSLAIVDPNARKVLATVPTGEQPHEVAVTADGRIACVTNYGGGPAGAGRTLSIIDIPGRKELHRVDLAPLARPHGVWANDGKCWFTAEANKVIGRYDPASNAVDTVIGTGQNTTHMVLPLPDESKIFTSNIGSGTITIVERNGVNNWSNTDVPVGKGPEGFDLTPDGKQIWAANSQDGTVTIVDVYTKRPIQTFRVQTKRSNRLKFSPDGRLVLISDLEAGELLVLERDTKKELGRIKLGRQPAGILITPDSTRAYVAVTGDNNVAVINLGTLEIADRLQTGNGPDGMAWIP